MEEIFSMEAWLQWFPNAGVKELYEKIEHEPKFLYVDTDAVFVDTPLHVAVRHGRKELALEILQLMPSQGRKLNPKGYSPLHIALLEGHEELVRAMVKLDPELTRVAGRERMTPLHYAAQNDDTVDLLAFFLLYCPDSIQDLTVLGETAVHVAVRNHRANAFKVLHGWLYWKGREQVLQLRNWEGKSVSDLANGQTEVAAILNPDRDNVERLIELFKETMNRIISWSNSNYHTLVRVLMTKMAQSISSLSSSNPSNFVDYLCSSTPRAKASVRRKLEAKLNSETRNAILVVAVLIATAAFQAVLSPPGGFTDDNPITITNTNKNKEGPLMMSRKEFTAFALLNSFAFAFSLSVILLVLPISFYNAFLYISIVFFLATYILAITITSPDQKTIIIVAVLLPDIILGFAFLQFENGDFKDDEYWKRIVDQTYASRNNTQPNEI